MPLPTPSPRLMSHSTTCGSKRRACSITSAAVGPSVVSTSQPRADSASWRPIATRAWSSTMSTRAVMTAGAGSASTNDVPPPRRERTRRSSPPCSAISRWATCRPSPRAGALVAAHPALEHVPAQRRGDARSPILDEDDDRIVEHRDAHVDRRRGGVLADVVEQGHHDLRGAVAPAFDLDAGRQDERHVEPGGPGAGDHRADRVAEIERAQRRVRRPSNEGAHPADLRDQAVHELVDLGVGQLVAMLAKPGRRRLDAEQRGTQFVVALVSLRPADDALPRSPRPRERGCSISVLHASLNGWGMPPACPQ